MKMTHSLVATLLLMGCTISLMPTITLAQSADGFGGDGDRNPFSRAAAGDTAGLMKLINEAQLNGKVKGSSYVDSQKDQINSATEEFRVLQLQALQQERNRKSGAAVAAPKP